MSSVTTLDKIWQPLMDGPSIRADHCVVCGMRGPVEMHHIVRRSQGQLVRDGKVVPKPVIPLCGRGNILSMGGRPFCHGLAHHNMLHFRFRDGRYEFLRTHEPTKYQDALEMPGWAPLHYI